jgi:prepilin-type N-terminal cleavage/methylation domain-containing protein
MTGRSRRDDGFTLVEVIVAVALMALAFVAILGGMAMFAKAQRAQSVRADLDAKVRTAAESVLTATYVPCASSYAVTVPAGYTATTSVSMWDGKLPAGFVTGAPCTDNGLQRVAITITNTSARRSDTLTVGKRN